MFTVLDWGILGSDPSSAHEAHQMILDQAHLIYSTGLFRNKMEEGRDMHAAVRSLEKGGIKIW